MFGTLTALGVTGIHRELRTARNEAEKSELPDGSIAVSPSLEVSRVSPVPNQTSRRLQDSPVVELPYQSFAVSPGIEVHGGDAQ